ncbi:MAG: MarR family winged helix-turn-helix transcriptional regulator [Pirellula sp.]
MSKSVKVNQELAKEVGSACLCLALQRTARMIGRAYDDALRPLDLTNGQFSLLMSMARDNPATITELAPSLGMDRTTLTAYLKPLERRGLVKVVPNPEDARSRLPILTDEGKKLLAKAVPLWEKIQGEVKALVQVKDLDSTKQVLKSLTKIGKAPPT